MSLKVQEILNEVEMLSDEERNELLRTFKERYGRTFTASENFNFWFDGPDDIYDQL